MSHASAPNSLEALNKFKFERILNEDPLNHSLHLLGTFPGAGVDNEQVSAIVRIEKTALNPIDATRFFGEMGLVQKVEVEGSTDIYTWLFAWIADDRESDLKVHIVCPATEAHIRKYTRQEQKMFNETPALYEKVVKPYIEAVPASRTQWVDNILLGISEKEKILYSCEEFLILPDMKWDLKTISSLYLMAIVQDRTIRSLRDLRKKHVPLLNAIRLEAGRVVHEKWGLGNGALRIYIHYQPSYYHFHVHIVNVNYQGAILGMTIGQAHLLEDVISLLQLDPEEGPAVFERLTLTYGLGDQHGLFQALQEAILE